MFTRPDDLTERQILQELAANWDFAARTLDYLPAGFGAHHWRAADAAGRELFLIVHDLPGTLHSRLDTPDAAFGRLETAFGCALSLRRDAGLEFVIAPVPAAGGKVVRRVSQRYSLAACPYLAEAEPGHEGGFPEADRPAVIRLLARLHRAAPAVAPRTCDFGLQNADGLRAAIDGAGEPWRTGRYGERARALLARHAAGVTALMTAYDLVRDRDVWDVAGDCGVSVPGT